MRTDVELLDDCRKIITETGEPSISKLQRRLGIGYCQAARIMDMLETEGFVTGPNKQGIRTMCKPGPPHA